MMKTIDETIRESISLLKSDINAKPNYFLTEFDLQARLYYHLCNLMKEDFYNIHLEHNPHYNYNKDRYHRMWKKCLQEYSKDIQIPKFRKDIYDEKLAKKGKYDISIFSEDNKDIYEYYYAIELKKITSCNSETHKGYEDLYVLSDLIKKDNTRFKKVETYFFIYVNFNSNKKMSPQDMENYISNIQKTHKKAKINFDYYIYDNNTKNSYLLSL